MIKPSDKMLEVQQTWDLTQIYLREKYEQDLAVIQRCKDELDKVQAQRTFEYEQEYLKELRKYEENSLRFDERRGAEPVEVENVN